MELIRNWREMDARLKRGVLSVGVFDGVHLGHQAVLGRAVERARETGAAALVFTFHPHPLAVLRPEQAPPLIQTFGQKLELMRRLGLDAVLWPEDVRAVLAMEPEAFVREVVCDALEARLMVEGADFHFGRAAGGDLADLARRAEACGARVETVEPVTVDGQRVSSTRIRRAVAEGRVEEAACCLGRPYAYVGTVTEGRRRGTRLGFPTVNLTAPAFLMPGEGVYAGWAHVRERRYRAAVAVGRAPTFHPEGPPVVEAFLIDFDGDLYGTPVTLEFVARLRAQRTFPDADALAAQIARDCERAREVLS